MRSLYSDDDYALPRRSRGCACAADFLAAARSAEAMAARETSASARQFWLTIAATHRDGAAMLAQMGR